jgi:hypothetical protein
MRGSPFTMVSLVLFLLALAAWGGVYYLYSDVGSRLDDRARSIANAQTQSVQQQKAFELSALATQTAAQRSALDQEVSADVVGIAAIIQSAGEAAGTQTVIGAASEGPADKQSGASILSVAVQSTGTFAQVWRAAQLFEALPLPSDVQELDFEQIPSAKGGSWQLTAHINALTTSQTSS